MGAARWWLLPLAIAAVLDVGLIARYETSPGIVVSRAVVRTTGGGHCETSTLVRSDANGDPTDDLFVSDTWTQNRAILSVDASPEFVPGGGLVQESEQVIDEGLDIENQPVQPVPAALVKAGRGPLVQNYLSQMRRGTPWLSGPCVPFANPMHSHLQRVGLLQGVDGSYAVYRGRLTTQGTSDEFAKSEVWLGVRADGRIGFELLKQLPAPNADLSIVFVAKLFTYPGQQLSVLARQPADQRIAFYNADYADMLHTIDTAQTLGPPVPPLPAPKVTLSSVG